MNPNSSIKVSPSLLSADFGRLADEVRLVEDAGCDYIHVDVMDGHFVPNITIGPFVVKAIKKVSRVPLDVHLMIDSPWKYIPDFAAAGSDIITVHAEACGARLAETLDQISSLGKRPGVSLKPGTPLDPIKPLLDKIAMVLIMTVEPGFGGQSFMPDMMPKVEALRKIYNKDIEVDGGINTQTGALAVRSGANVLVAGTAVFRAPDVPKAVRDLKELKA
jgi:ribulose-phosphate 3-epimerase